MKEKIEITQELCVHVKALLDGGLTQKQAAKFVKVSPATVSRISAAGFDVGTYMMNTERRRIMENDAKAAKKIKEFLDAMKQNQPLAVEKVEEKDGGLEVTARPAEEQVPGQISMDLKPSEEEKPEMSDQTKMMRFLAAKFGDLNVAITASVADLIAHIVRLEDYTAQILRRMDK